MHTIPHWMMVVCTFTTFASIIIAIFGITMHIFNYRKPFEQRLIVRILVLVPLFSISCYVTLLNQRVGQFITPITEIYEAFVIYCFYKLLIIMLQGERHIVRMTSNREPVSHPFPMNYICKPIDLSDPSDFLHIKRSILQYVWVKPLLFSAVFIADLLGKYDDQDMSLHSVYLWELIIYNVSITISLYSLAIFWKCLYDDLSVFNPWGKFLCVKMIIFASYWQGLFIGILSWFGLFDSKEDDGDGDYNRNNTDDFGLAIQSALLCVEMIGFAIFHSISFPYTDFTRNKLFDSARFKTIIALKDWISIGDLIYDIKITTLYGDTYNFRNFESMNNEDSNTNLSLPESSSPSPSSPSASSVSSPSPNQLKFPSTKVLKRKVDEGLRFSEGGNKKYWLPQQDKHNKRPSSTRSSNGTLTPSDMTPLLGFKDGIGNGNGNYASSSKNDNSMEYAIQEGEVDEYKSGMYERDEKLYAYVRKHYIGEDKINYPIEYEYKDIEYTKKLDGMRRELLHRDRGARPPDSSGRYSFDESSFV